MLKQKKASFFIGNDSKVVDNSLLEFGNSLEKNKIINSSEPVEILSAIGVSIDLGLQKDFSFKQTQKNEEAVANPNIIERKDYKKFNNEYDKPDDKFPNEDDPFYQLDDARDQNEKQITKETPASLNVSLDRVADDILRINLDNNNSIKQFRSQS
tara:strand:- start:833 stop:1297 length:465 start_codon:yes stop_codon:yes gene_type:complete